MVSLLSGLDEGTFRQHTQRRPDIAKDMRPQDVVGSILSGILPEAKRYVERRRGLSPIGVLAIARLLKATTAGYGAVRASDTTRFVWERPAGAFSYPNVFLSAFAGVVALSQIGYGVCMG